MNQGLCTEHPQPSLNVYLKWGHAKGHRLGSNLQPCGLSAGMASLGHHTPLSFRLHLGFLIYQTQTFQCSQQPQHQEHSTPPFAPGALTLSGPFQTVLGFPPVRPLEQGRQEWGPSAPPQQQPRDPGSTRPARLAGVCLSLILHTRLWIPTQTVVDNRVAESLAGSVHTSVSSQKVAELGMAVDTCHPGH